MSWSNDRIGGLVLLCLFAFYGLQAQHIELLPIQQSAALTARTLPYTFTVLGLLGAFWLVLKPTHQNGPAVHGLRWWRLGLFLLLMSVYGLVLRPLGFVLSSVLFLAAGFWLLGERRLWALTVVALVVTLVFWALLNLGLGVHLAPLPVFGSR